MTRLTFFYFLYNIIWVLGSPIIILTILLRWFSRIQSHSTELSVRLGVWPKELIHALPNNKWIWVHVASMGELKAVLPFLKQAPSTFGCPIVLSVMVPEALTWARSQHLADFIVPAPIDGWGAPARILKATQPLGMVFVESELWPNWLKATHQRGIPVVVMNGRLSKRSMERYRLFNWLLSPFWKQITFVLARDQQDAMHFKSVGVPEERISVLGNLKYDVLHPALVPKPPSDFLTITLGSTREGEEALLLPALKSFLQTDAKIQLILAPRHLHRLKEVSELLQSSGLTPVYKSQGDFHTSRIVLWDTMGELLEAYQISDVVIVGGSFVDKGGQNPIEPAAMGRAIVFGPHMSNFQDVSEKLVRASAAFQTSSEKLEAVLSKLISDEMLRENMQRAAFETIRSEQGATHRTLEFLKKNMNR